MPTPFDQLLQDLRDAQGDTARLALVTLDFATAADPLLREAATAAAIPSWFDAPILAALLPEHAAEAPALVEKLRALPMVQPYSRFPGHDASALHEATRLALRDRLLATDPDLFRLLSRRAAAALGSPDPDAPDIRLTCEHLYHLLAGQTEEGDEAFATVTGQWSSEFRTERLQTLARLLDELLAARPAPPLLPRGQGLTYLNVADARENHQPVPLTHALVVQAEAIFRSLVGKDPANAGWQRDLCASLDMLGDLAVARGELDAALRYYTEGKDIAARLAASDPANAGWQRDLYISLVKLGELAVDQGDVPAALRCFTEGKTIAERLAASDPANAGWQRDLSVTLNKLGDLAVAQGERDAALRCFTESKDILERLAASDPAKAGWQRDLSVSLNKLGDLAVARGELDAALRFFTEGKDIRERLAASDPANAGWQRDLAQSHCWVGNVQMENGDLAKAEVSYTKYKDTMERLAASDPANAGWQRDLSVSLEKLGDLAVARGDLDAALRSFTGGKAIAALLAASDPANARWQRDLFYSYWVIAMKVLTPQERWAEALALMEQGLAISERLAATDPTNVMWQNDVQVTRAQVAVLREKAGR